MTNKEFFASSWHRESAISAKAIRSLPGDMAKLNFRHHPKFRSPWELVNHFGPHSRELTQAVTEGRLDLVNEGKFDMNATHIYKTTEEAAKTIEEQSAALIEVVKNCDESTWMNKIIPVYWGQAKIFEMPLWKLCWTMHNDVIHHRGELASYYRLIGAVQPNLYGPTAEEEEAMAAKAN